MPTGAAHFSGSCLCRSCVYQIDGGIEPAGVCHCEDCRKVTGGPFGVSFRVPKDRFHITGRTASYSKPADSGTVLTRHFCPVCGSPLYTESGAHADAVYVKAGTLDQPEAITIERQAWLASAVAWAAIPPGVATYQKGRI
ncbi:MAG: GFA family protein [Hyphomonas sp.]|nr:GFA family protein [Hyphomonas sp.]MCB9963238.1 GFA family protein [Hyphomonas sp.]MCB9970155.1 GFA family protein [Hyphomonas sp.]